MTAAPTKAGKLWTSKSQSLFRLGHEGRAPPGDDVVVAHDDESDDDAPVPAEPTAGEPRETKTQHVV